MPQDMMSTLKGLLGDNAEEKIQSVLSALGNSGSAPPPVSPQNLPDQPGQNQNILQNATSNLEALEYIGKLKGMVEDMGRANDPRSTLLMSLKPYMRTGRQKSIDNAIRLLNISKFSGLFKL